MAIGFWGGWRSCDGKQPSVISIQPVGYKANKRRSVTGITDKKAGARKNGWSGDRGNSCIKNSRQLSAVSIQPIGHKANKRRSVTGITDKNIGARKNGWSGDRGDSCVKSSHQLSAVSIQPARRKGEETANSDARHRQKSWRAKKWLEWG
jgi:hypothetical protein